MRWARQSQPALQVATLLRCRPLEFDGQTQSHGPEVGVERLGNEHVLLVKGWDFVVQHPLTERFEGRLFNCTVTDALHDVTMGLDDGQYRLEETPLGWEARKS